MGAEKSYKPSEIEIKKGEEMISLQQRDEGFRRQTDMETIGRRYEKGSERLKNDIEEATSSFDHLCSQFDSSSTPPELTRKIEEAKRIQSEILQKLKELKAL